MTDQVVHYPDDPLSAPRGVLNGLILGGVMWGVIVAGIMLAWRWVG